MTARTVQLLATDDARLLLEVDPAGLVAHTEIVRAALAVTIDPAAGARLQSIEVLDLAVATPILRALLGADAVVRLAEATRELILGHLDFGRRQLDVEWDDRLAATLARRAELDWLDRLSPCELFRPALRLERGLLAADSGLDELVEVAAFDALDGSTALGRMLEMLESGSGGLTPVVSTVLELVRRHADLVGPPETIAELQRAATSTRVAEVAAAQVDWDRVFESTIEYGAVSRAVRELEPSREGTREPVDYVLPLDVLHLEREIREFSGAYASVFAAQWEDRTGGRLSVAVRVAVPVEHGGLRIRLVDADGGVGFDAPLAPTKPSIVEAIVPWPQPLRAGEHLEVYSPSLDVGPDDHAQHDEHLLAIRVAEALQFERLAAQGARTRGELLGRADRAWDAARATAADAGRDVAWLARLDERRSSPVPVELALAEELLGR